MVLTDAVMALALIRHNVKLNDEDIAGRVEVKELEWYVLSIFVFVFLSFFVLSFFLVLIICCWNEK